MMMNEKRILLVDDEPHALIAMKIALANEGFIIMTATTGNEFLELLENEEFDLVLLDMMMPGPPPDELIQILNERNNPPLVLYVTAMGLSEGKKKEFECYENVRGIVEKPFSNKDLVERVKKALEEMK